MYVEQEYRDVLVDTETDQWMNRESESIGMLMKPLK